MPSTPPHGFIRLAGSERTLPPHARWIEQVDPHERIEVSVYLRDPAANEISGSSAAGSAAQC